MSEEKIPFYKTNNFLIFKLEGELGLHEEYRLSHGFLKRSICEAYFYNANLNFFEINIYSRGDISICELWDSEGLLFCFATDSHLQELELIERYLKIVSQMIKIEQGMKKIWEEDE